MAWKVQKANVNLEPLVQLLTQTNDSPKNQGHTVESHTARENAADNEQASSPPSQSNANRRNRRGYDQQADAISQDSQGETTGSNAKGYPAFHGDPCESATGRHQERYNEQRGQNRFLLSFIPDKTPQPLDQDLIEPGTIVKDTTLIRTIRRRYMNHRPWYRRVISLQGFNNLTITKVGTLWKCLVEFH